MFWKAPVVWNMDLKRSFLTSPGKAYPRTSSIIHTVALSLIYSVIVPGSKQAGNKENIAAF